MNAIGSMYVQSLRTCEQHPAMIWARVVPVGAISNSSFRISSVVRHRHNGSRPRQQDSIREDQRTRPMKQRHSRVNDERHR